MPKIVNREELRDEKVKRLVTEVARSFPSFGGAKPLTRSQANNPIAHWTKDKPAIFALGVDIESVVRFILERA